MSSPIYRHYGNDEFINRKYNITNNCGKKPRGGLWASPKGCDLPWRTWCIGENFHTERLKRHFDFKLRRNTKILKIRSVNDIIPYLIKGNSWNEDSEERMRLFNDPTYDMDMDLNAIMKEYDGIRLYMSDNYMELHYSDMFSWWDVDSIVIWNLNKVVPI